MADLNRPDYGVVFASQGEKLPPDSTKMQLGWVQEMMPYQWQNFLESRQDEAITYLMQKGVPEYSATQEYIANKSTVLYQGNLYIATATVTGVLPTVTASWKRISPTIGANGAVGIASGGTGATDATTARTNLGLGSIATANLPATNGVLVRNGANSIISRTLVGTTGDIVVANPDGASGNITLSVGSNVAKTNQDSTWTSKAGITLPRGTTAERGTAVAGKIRYNTTLQKFEGYNGTSWEALGAASEIEITTLSGDGVTTVFTLNTPVFSEVSTDVYIGGLWQDKGTYSVSDSTLTFSEAPTFGTDNIQVVSRRVVDLGVANASQVAIQDTSNYYTSPTVEGALREVGEDFAKLTSYTGNISADAQWSEVPAHSDPAFDVQTQVLANRTQWILANSTDTIYLKAARGVFDGVTDDTEVLRAVHTAANAIGATVSYEGITSIAVRANARINVNTDINPAGCKLVVIGGSETITTWTSEKNTIFVVSDPACPIESIETGIVASESSWHKGSVNYLEHLQKSGYFRISLPGFLVPTRDDSGKRFLTFPCYTVDGASNLPLFVDLRGKVSGATAIYRKDSAKDIDLGDFHVDLKDANNQIVFSIERNRVSVGLRWDKNNHERNSSCELIKISEAGCVHVREATGAPMDMPVGVSGVASYVFHPVGASKVSIENLDARGRGFQFASEKVSDLRVSKSKMFRFDVHDFGFDVFVSDCDIEYTIQYGFGGGDWLFRDIRFVSTGRHYSEYYPLFKVRGDYGGCFFGSIDVDGLKVRLPDSVNLTMVGLYDVGSLQVDAPLPSYFKVRNVEISLYPTDSPPVSSLWLLRIQRKTASENRFTFSNLIDIDGVHLDCPRIQFANLVFNAGYATPPSGAVRAIKVRNITTANNIVLRFEMQSGSLPSAPKWLDLHVSDIGDGIDTKVVGGTNVIHGMYVNRIQKLSEFGGSAWPWVMSVGGVVIDYRTTTNKVFGFPGTVQNFRYTLSLKDAVVYGDPDFSCLNLMQGVEFRRNGPEPDFESQFAFTPVLPAGATIETAFTGWKSADVYK